LDKLYRDVKNGKITIKTLEDPRLFTPEYS